MSAGGTHICVLKTDGTVVCWGDNSFFQAEPPTGTFTQVSAGGLKRLRGEDRWDLACWGDNTYGQLQNVQRVQGITPVAGYTTITGAFNECINNDIVELATATFGEDINFDGDVAITMRGGFDWAFQSQAGYSVIAGTLTISTGTVTVENIVIRQAD